MSLVRACSPPRTSGSWRWVERGCSSTLQVFRAQLILHDKVLEVFESSLRLARESGCLKGRGMRVALDTTNILGRGAVKDTYNLLADGIVKLLRALAAVEQAPVREWAQAREYERYLGSSVKSLTRSSMPLNSGVLENFSS